MSSMLAIGVTTPFLIFTGKQPARLLGQLLGPQLANNVVTSLVAIRADRRPTSGS